MVIDIRTLVLVLGLTHVLQILVFIYQYSISKTYRGTGWWLTWSAAEIVGFSSMFLQGTPSVQVLATISRSTLIVLGVIFLYIGFVRFLGRKENRLLLASIFTVYLAAFLYFLFVRDTIPVRSVIRSVALAAVSLLSARTLWVYKIRTIAGTANFIVAVFIAHGCYYIFRAVAILAGAPVGEVFAPTLVNVSAYLDAIIVGTLWTFGIIIMINQRLNAEVTDAKEKTELFFNTTPDAVIITRLSNGLIASVNEGFCALTGFSRDEVVGKTVFDIRLWENPDERRHIVDGLRAKGLIDNFESIFRRKNGRELIGLLSARLIHLDGVPHLISVTRDITERKRVERTLQESEENFRRFLDESPLGVRIVTANGETLYANRAILDIYGFDSLEELKATPVTKRYTAESYVEYQKRYARRLEGEDSPSEYEVSIVRKNGEVRHLLASRKAQLWNGQRQYQVLYRDITAQKQAEEDRRVALVKYKTLFETFPLGITVSDSRGQILESNLMSRKLLGLPLEEHWRRDIDGKELRVVRPDGAPMPTHEYASVRALKEKRRIENVEMGIVKAHGEITWLSITAAPLPLEGYGVVIVYRDISERKAADEEKIKLEGQLQQAQKMELVGRLAGGVAHDFNNILQIIVGNAELALAEMEPGNPLRPELEQINNAGERGANLTRQLLGFARKQPISPRPMDLNETVEGMLKMLRRLIGENIEMIWRPRPGLWTTLMDSSQIDQILVNLCVNARDVITSVGMVHIATENIRVDELHVSRHDGVAPGDYVLLTVSDTGRGMDKETKGQLFEPFFTTKKVGKGIGLGLATVYGIVTQNHGYITVYSELGMGATFHIYLPRYLGKGASTAADPEKAVVRGSETLLLVEDDLPLLSLYCQMLQRLGYSVLAAGTLEAALGHAEKHADKIRLLVTDVVMPGMRGPELAHRLKTRHPHLKCLFMSGFTAEIVNRQGILKGAGHFIQKPFSMADLSVKLREVLVGGSSAGKPDGRL